MTTTEAEAEAEIFVQRRPRRRRRATEMMTLMKQKTEEEARRREGPFLPYSRRSSYPGSFVLLLVACLLMPDRVTAQDTLPPFFGQPSAPEPTPTNVEPDPTPDPVQAPVAAPEPTPQPSAMPSISFQPTTTPFPTSSHQPTTTTQPSVSPTRAPTDRPTQSPVRAPTTEAPTKRPTASPSESPSAVPSAAPTPLPTAQPTISPEPTSVTKSPTRSPKPSSFPSSVPTPGPTGTPSLAPSSIPSLPPTSGPSASPSSAPTLPDQNDLVAVVMCLDRMTGPMQGRTAIDYEAVTESHIKQTVLNLDLSEEPVTDLRVDVNIDSQRQVEFCSAPPTNRRGRTRQLQNSNLKPLRVAFSAAFEYKSPGSYDAAIWVGEAFNSEAERDAYINRLKQTNDDFDTVEAVEVLVEGEVPPEIVEPEDGSSSSNTVWIAVGAVVGSLAAIALAVLFVRYRGREKGDYDSTKKMSSQGDEGFKYAAEIDVDRQDDISTLGDPMLGMAIGTSGESRADRTASVGGDYDYAKTFFGAVGSMEDSNRSRLESHDLSSSRVSSSTSGFSKSGLGPVGSAMFMDEESSFEQQFDEAGADSGANEERFSVDVPPGKLGMVIDNPQGVPVVHAIKPESVLHGRALVGDKLVSVDGEDVTRMSAVQISKLISMKSDQHRQLVFRRNLDKGPPI